MSLSPAVTWMRVPEVVIVFVVVVVVADDGMCWIRGRYDGSSAYVSTTRRRQPPEQSLN